MAPQTPGGLAQDRSLGMVSSMASASNAEKASTPNAEKSVAHSVDDIGAEKLSSSASLLPGQSHAAQVDEVTKRRRLGYDSVQPAQRAGSNFDSDSVKALFNIGHSQTAVGQAQPNTKTNMFMPSKTAPLGLDAPFDFAIPGAGANGSVPNTSARNLYSGFAGFNGNPTAFDSNLLSGGTPRSVSSNFAFSSQTPGFVIPGLGAPFKHLGAAASGVKNEKSGTPPVNKSNSTVVAPEVRHGDNLAGNPDQSQSTSNVDRLDTKMEQQITSSDNITGHSANKQLSSVSPQISKAEKTISEPKTPEGPKKETSPKVATGPKEPPFVRPDGPPPVWIEKQTSRSFKLQRVLHNPENATFDGAYDILSTLNPDHFQMTYGSSVVAIKCNSIDNMIISMQTGYWSTNHNVMERIMTFHKEHKDKSEKTLLILSMPGSKHFCGLAELQSYDDDIVTDFLDKDEETPEKGAMVIRWLYCKLVPFDEVRKVEVASVQESVTQMWNGMHYGERTGREVIRIYIETPHTENLLSRPRGDFFRKVIANSKLATHYRTTWEPPFRNGSRFQQNSRPAGGNANRKGRMDDAKNQRMWRHQHASQPETVSQPKVQAKESTEVNMGVQPNSSMSNNYGQLAEPKLQFLPVLVHADGTVTAAGTLTAPCAVNTAPSLQSSFMMLDSPPILGVSRNSSTQSLNPLAQSQILDPMAQVQNLGSMAQMRSMPSMYGSNSFTSQLVNTPAVLSGTGGHRRTPSGLSNGMAAPLNAPAVLNSTSGHRRSSSGLSNGMAAPLGSMPPPPRPFPAQHGSIPRADNGFGTGVRGSSPSANRASQNVNIWSYGGAQLDTAQPQTPMRGGRSSYSLSGSPMETTPFGTPTPRRIYGHSHDFRQSSGGSLHGQYQAPTQSDSSPMSVRMSTPVRQQDTPRPSRGHVHDSRDSDALSAQQAINKQWVDKLVETQDDE